MTARLRVLLTASLALAACASPPQGGAIRCEPGETGSCRCDDGASGTRACGADRRFGACTCLAPYQPVLELGGDPDPTGAADRLLAFPPTPIDGGSAELAIPVRNAGGGRLTVELSAIDGPFAATGWPVEPLGDGEEGTLRFRFAPDHGGEAGSSVSVITNGGTQRIRFEGTGFVARATCTPEALDLGTVVVGLPVPFAITCANEGDVPWPAALAVEGTDAAEVAAALDDPEPGLDGAWQLAGTLTAGHVGAIAARLVLSAGGEPVATVPLAATARADAIEIPESIDLGYLPTGILVSTTVDLTNYGPSPVRILRAYLTPETDAQFEPIDWVPSAIPAAAGGNPGTVRLAVMLRTPADRVGFRVDGVLAIELEGEAAPRTIRLTAFVGGPVLLCTPSPIEFGEVGVGFPTTLPVVCTNAGTDDPTRDDDALVVAGVDSSNPVVRAAVRGGSFRDGYRVGESFTLDVTVTPTTSGEVQARLQIPSNAINVLDGSLAVPVHGVAITLLPCEVEVVPGALAFGRVDRERPVVLELGIVNRTLGRCQLRDLRLGEGCDPAFSLPAGDVPTTMLEPLEVFHVPVAFAPTAYSAQPFACEARFGISHAAAPEFVVPITGLSQEPCLVFDPPELDFGPVRPGCTGGKVVVKAYNACPGTRTVRRVTPVPTAGDEFAALAVTIAPAGADPVLTFEARYRPGDEGADLGGYYVYVDGDIPYLVPARGRGSLEPTRADRFEQRDSPKVDALFVIDNGAMLEQQNQLALNVTPLLSFAQAQGIDFQIGVTTSGFTAAGCPGGAGGAESGRLFPVDNARPRIVTPQTPNRDAVLAANFQVGACSTDHRLLDAALVGLLPPVIDHCDDPRFPQRNDGNCGFLRSGAHLSIVAVTSGEDLSAGPAASFAPTFRSLKPTPNLLSFHAVTGNRGTGCNSAGGSAVAGDRLIDVVDAIGGSFHSICTSNWTQLASDLSAKVFGFETCFPLTSAVDPGPDGVLDDADVALTMDGLDVPPVATDGHAVWHFRPAQGAICFEPLAAPEPGTQLSVTYAASCTQP